MFVDGDYRAMISIPTYDCEKCDYKGSHWRFGTRSSQDTYLFLFLYLFYFALPLFSVLGDK